MTTLQNDDLSRDLARSLESATSLMTDLLGDIKYNATSLATLKVKLESLSGSVESLSHIVREGNGKGSMVTRIALAEQSLLNIEVGFNDLKEELNKSLKEIKDGLASHIEEDEKVHNDVTKLNKEKALARLKLVAVVAPGVIALSVMIIKLLMGESLP